MANKFEKKEWVDRQSQYPSRRKLTETTIENVYEVERAEGEVTEPGNAFDAQNMNDLEDRIFAALGSLDGADITILDRNNLFTKTNLEDVLVELFMYASNGKTLIANAIGGSPGSTFQALSELAGAIKSDRDNGKTLIANAVGGSASMSFSQLAVLADTSNIKKTIASAIGNTKSGTPTGNESIEELANFIKNDKLSFYYFNVASQLSTDLYSYSGAVSSRTLSIPCSLPFVPSFVIIENIETQGYGSNIYDVSYITLTNNKEDYGDAHVSEFFDINISNITNTAITLSFTARSKLSQRYEHINFILSPYNSYGPCTRIYTFK